MGLLSFTLGLGDATAVGSSFCIEASCGTAADIEQNNSCRYLEALGSRITQVTPPVFLRDARIFNAMVV